MTPSAASLLHPAFVLAQHCRVLFTQLVRSGITDVVISPGSRSTPLVLAALREPGLQCHSVIDERSAAFFALGMARTSARPVALVCTSGSAGGHYLPAVIEAAMADVPLVLLTADRPAALQGCGAPQTIPQGRLFGDFTRASATLEEPGPGIERLQALHRKVRDHLARAQGLRPGPVHLNCPFAKPLEPRNADTLAEKRFETQVDQWLAGCSPTSLREEKTSGAAPQLAPFLEVALPAGARSVVTVGPASRRVEELARHLARAAGALCLTEFSAAGKASPIEFLPGLWEQRAAGGAPDTILHVGMPCVSSSWARFLESYAGGYYVLPGSALRDPSRRAARAVVGQLETLLPEAEQVQSQRGQKGCRQPALQRLLDGWPARVGVALRATERSEEGESAEAGARCPSEPGTLLALHEAAGAHGADLLLGNSLSIRLASWVAPAVESPPHDFFTARGANGIDGWLAAAAGSAASSQRPTLAVVGDVTAAHDIGSLSLCRRLHTPLVVALLDNSGGRLFDYLPVRNELNEEDYRFFRTETGHDWKAICAGFGVRYERCCDAVEVSALTAAALQRQGFTLIHVPTRPELTQRYLELLREPVSQ